MPRNPHRPLHVIYVPVWAEAVYVGRTTDLASRLAVHRRSAETRAGAAWRAWGDPIEIQLVDHLSNEAEAVAAELEVIRDLGESGVTLCNRALHGAMEGPAPDIECSGRKPFSRMRRGRWPPRRERCYRCRHCGRMLSGSSYHRDRTRSSGLSSGCSQCSNFRGRLAYLHDAGGYRRFKSIVGSMFGSGPLRTPLSAEERRHVQECYGEDAA